MRHALTRGGQKLALGLAAALTVALPIPAQAGPATPTPPAPAPVSAVGEGAADATVDELAPSGDEAFSPDILTASTSLTARDLARETGQRVEVLDQRTTTSSLYALPDGSWQVAQSGAAKWAQVAGDGSEAGDWANVDVRLVPNDDGSFSPAAHAKDIVVNGGNGEFFRLSDPTTGLLVSLALSDGSIPAPVVDGSRATFADVAPDTDLMVEIRPSGYEYFLVLKTPAAAASSRDIPLVLTISGATKSPRADGGFDLVDASGTVVGAMSAPVAWDANDDLKSGSPVLDEWSARPEFAPVTRALDDLPPEDRVAAIRDFLASGDDLQTRELVKVEQDLAPTATPDSFAVDLNVPADWASDPATTYPLVLDPDGGVAAAFDTFVQYGTTSDQSGATELRLGTYDGGAHVARSFLSFEWKDYQYTAVQTAALNLWEWHSWSCSPATWYSYLAAPANTGTRWTAQPWFGEPRGVSSQTKGFSSSCTQGSVKIDVTGAATEWSKSSAGTYHSIALTAASESSNSGWKKFNSNEAGWGQPWVELTYTSIPPKAPSDIRVNGALLKADSRTDLTIKRPEFSATVTDADELPVGATGPRKLHAIFVLYKDGVEVGHYDGTAQDSGGTSKYTPTTDLEEGANYTLYVATVFNGSSVSAGIQGGGKFTTTSTPPAEASALKINSLHIPTGVAQADGTVKVGTTALVLPNLREIVPVGDANNDTHTDLLAWNLDGTLRLYLGDGAGGVQSLEGAPVAGNWSGYTRIIGPGKWDNDNFVDLITMNATGALYFNQGHGAGAFDTPGLNIGNGWGGYQRIFGAGDWDKDGHRDVVALTTSSVLYLYRGDGGIGILPDAVRPVIGTGGWSSMDAVLFPGDFNPTGDTYNAVDIVVWLKSTGALHLYYGKGGSVPPGDGGQFSTAWKDPVKVFAPGDFNGSGTSDLLALNVDGTLTLFDGNGTGGISTIGTVVGVAAAPGATLAPQVLADSTPAFSAVVSDPDGGLVRAVFSLYRRRPTNGQSEGEWELIRNDLYGSWVTSGQRSYFGSSASPYESGLEAAFLAGNEYRIEVRSQDKALTSATALTTGILKVAPTAAAPEIPSGCDTFTGTPGGSSTTC